MKTLTIRVEDELALGVGQLAQAQDVSVNALITRLIADYCRGDSNHDSIAPHPVYDDSRLLALEANHDALVSRVGKLEKAIADRTNAKQAREYTPALTQSTSSSGKTEKRHPTLGERSSKNELPRRI